jgi:hypothetical protein
VPGSREVVEETDVSMSHSDIVEETDVSMSHSDIVEETDVLMSLCDIAEETDVSMSHSDIVEGRHCVRNRIRSENRASSKAKANGCASAATEPDEVGECRRDSDDKEASGVFATRARDMKILHTHTHTHKYEHIFFQACGGKNFGTVNRAAQRGRVAGPYPETVL